MGRGSKIKHIEKNNFSKFKQVLVKKEDKEKSKNKGPGTSKPPETSKESDRPQTSECVDRLIEHEIPQKNDGLEKSETTAEPQVKGQELPETSRILVSRKGQWPDRPPKSESPDTTVEEESSNKSDKQENPQRAEGLQVQSLKKPDTSKRHESPKRRGGKPEKTDISQKSESTLKPDENDRSKTPDKLTTPQWPKGPQMKIQKRPETLKDSERPQKSGCANRQDEHEIPRKDDRLEKSETTAEPQVTSQEMPEISQMLETHKEQEPDRPQKSENSFTIVEKKRSKKLAKHNKSQRAEGPQLQNLKKPDTSKRHESPKKRGGKLEKPDIFHKSEITLKPDEHDKFDTQDKTFDKLTTPQWPKGPQIKSQEKSEKPMGQTEKPEGLERPQKSESPDTRGNIEWPKKSDRIDKPKYPEKPQVKHQEKFEMHKHEHKGKTESLDRPQISEITHNNEHKKSWKPDTFDKHQSPVGSQVNNQEGLETSKSSEIPNGQKGEAGRHERLQKSDSLIIPDKQESSKEPDRLNEPQKPEGPQKAKSPDLSEKVEKPERQEKSESSVKLEKPERQDKSESSVKLEKPERQEKSESSVKLGKPERQEKCESSVKVEKPERQEKSESSVKLEKPERQENSESSVKVEKPERQEKSESSVKLEKPERQEKSESSVKLEKPERQEKSEKLEKVPEIEIKHPLEHTWGMWLITNDKRNWEDNLVKLTSFNTVEDYWCLYHHMKPPSELDRGKDYAVFKGDFRPMWEDPANRGGGRWLINFDKKRNEISDLDSIWMFVVLLVIGENFHVSDAICGAVVSVRTKSRIALWVSSYKNENAVKDVGHTLRNTLGLRGRLSFQQHDTNTSLLTL